MTLDHSHAGIDELVAAVLDTRALPEHLGPRDLLDADVIPPTALASQVYALRALLRTGGDDTPLAGRLADSRSVARHFTALLGSDTNESIWIVGCDAGNQVRFHRRVAKGGVARCGVSIGELMRPLIMNACVATVMVHNHPSGDPSPSAEDVDLTRRFGDACDLLGIRLLDHVIVGRGAHFSFLDSGLALGTR